MSQCFDFLILYKITDITLSLRLEHPTVPITIVLFVEEKGSFGECRVEPTSFSLCVSPLFGFQPLMPIFFGLVNFQTTQVLRST